MDTPGQRALGRAYRTYSSMIEGLQPQLEAPLAAHVALDTLPPLDVSHR